MPRRALYDYINPLIGGPEGTGWAFDADLNSALVFQLLEAVEGVERVDEVLFFEYDLRNHERMGFGKELVKLGDRLALPVVQPSGDRAMRRDDWLTHQLPVGMAEDDFLFRFVSIFQNVADTVMHQIDTLPHMFDRDRGADADGAGDGRVDRRQLGRLVARRPGAAGDRARVRRRSSSGAAPSAACGDCSAAEQRR